MSISKQLVREKFLRIYSSTPEFVLRDTYEKEHVSEFDLQAELYRKLKRSGFHVRGEVRFASCRLDLVVFKRKKGEALAIIEVKRERDGEGKSLDNEQGFKYRRFGVPVIQFYALSEYDGLVAFLKKEKESPMAGHAEEPLQTDVPKSFRALRLQTLFGRLKVASSAAFDAGQEVTNHIEKTLMSEIESTLENFIERMKKIDNVYFTERKTDSYRELIKKT